MFTKNLLLFSVIFFSITVSANSPTVFTPDFSARPVPIPTGTNLIPLCSNPMDTFNCFSQWSHQAIPLSVNTNPNILPNMQLFVPTFIPSNISPIFLNKRNIDNTNWKRYDFPSVSSSRQRSRSSRRSSRRDRDKQKKTRKIKVFGKEITVDPDKEDNSQPSNQEPVISETRATDAGLGETTVDTDVDETAVSEIRETTQTLQVSTSDPSKFRILEEDKNGNVRVLDGRIGYVPLDDIEIVEAPTPSTEPEVPSLPPAFGDKPTPPSLPKSSVEPEASSPSTFGDISLPKSSVEPEASSLPSALGGESTPPSPDSPSTELPTSLLKLRAKKDTFALPAGIKEIQTGCFVIDREQTQTEAGFCFECNPDLSDNDQTVVTELVTNTTDVLRNVDEGSSNKQVMQVGEGGVNTIKICSPDTSLQGIIKNFQNTCPSPYKDFKKFAQDVFCNSCSQGVAPEIMLAMMSIESAGKCEAVGTLNEESGEKSVGLFQVDSTQHICSNLDEEIKTEKNQCLKNANANKEKEKRCEETFAEENIECLKDPIKNLNTSIGILVEHYDEVNVEPLKQDECKDWLEMNPIERDSWRRAVAAYNGGSGWLHRILYSAENIDKTLENTNYLNYTNLIETQANCDAIKNCINNSSNKCNKLRRRKYKGVPLKQMLQNCLGMVSFLETKKNNSATWNMNWEELRTYYFLEKLSPGNKIGTGRANRWNKSNLAHTEAILGREAETENISYGMAELWREYIRKNNFKNNCPTR